MQGNAKFRKIAGFEFVKAYQAIHRAIPVRENFKTDELYNQSVDSYLNMLTVESELKRNIPESGTLDIWATQNLLSALATYDIPAYTGDNPDVLIDRVLDYVENEENIMQKECTKLLKAYSFKPKKITNP